MAKQLINPIERHVEKVVLVVTVLALVGVVVKYGITSPNVTELGGEVVTPVNIDAKIAERARSIQAAIREKRVDVEVPEPLVDDFKSKIALLELDPLAPLARPRPPVPIVDDPGRTLNQAQLVEVVPLPKPEVVHGRATFRVARELQDLYLPANWATISSVFDAKTQRERQRLAYGATRADIVYGPVEIQRRALRDDGTWSDEDWDFVDSQPRAKIPPLPPVPLVDRNGRPSIDTTTEKQIQNFLSEVSSERKQRELLRPLPNPIAQDRGDVWKFPVLTTYADVLKMDDELLWPKQQPAPDPEDLYGLRTVGPRVKEAVSGTDALAVKLDNAEELLKSARATQDENQATQAFNFAAQVFRDVAALRGQKDRAKRITEEADILLKDIQRAKRRGAGARRVVEDEEGPKRELLPTQQVWAHDMKLDSLPSGGIYQYRIRLNVVNRLVGEPSKFLNPEDATVIFIPGPWSEPSDPIEVDEDVEFYVTGADDRDNEIRVEMFQWFEGVWVKSRRFSLAIGDLVGGESRADVPSWEQEGKTEPAKVQFDASAVVLDMDFGFETRDRNDRKGIKFGNPKRDVSVVVMTESGDLSRRVSLTDKTHPGKKSAAARVFTPATSN